MDPHGEQALKLPDGHRQAAVHDAQMSVYPQSAEPKTGRFGTVMQTIDAANYAKLNAGAPLSRTPVNLNFSE